MRLSKANAEQRHRAGGFAAAHAERWADKNEREATVRRDFGCPAQVPASC